MTNSKLEKIRDEMAAKYGLDKFPVQTILTTNEFTQDVNFARRMTHNQSFQDGFDKSTAIHQEIIKKLLTALQEANEFTASVLDDLQHYFDNKCIPTMDELNQAVIADSQLRLVIGQALQEWENYE